MAQIKDLEAGVVRRLANREDARILAPFWIRDMLREVTDNYHFTELEDTGPEVALTIDERKYPIKTFLNGDSNDLSNVLCFELFTNYPTNTVSKILYYKELMAIVPMTRISSMPAFWNRHGNDILFGGRPDKPYTAIMYFQKRHPFTGTSYEELRENIVSVPDSWLEIIELGACERGAIELRLPDYVSMFHQVIYGDPANPGEPGLIKARIDQHQKDKSHNSANIPMIVSRY